uniref:Uncharacterized protein n=1 Tax=Tanacetum cinerariifolium TaxID=118510 RepID=A0A699K0N2_TANCI|nr:hypothetical protein [Tanacetum cinerariifolium]
MPKYTIKSIDKEAHKVYDQKSAIYQTMHENKSFNRNPANHRLYHALMEALTEDENVMDKGVTDTVVIDDAINTVGKDVVRDDDQPQVTSKPKTDKTPNPEWFKKPPRPPTPDLELNKRHVVLGQPEQLWFNQMVSATKDPLTFNDLMATPIDFSKYVLNRLKIDNLTQDLLLGPAYNLLKGTCTRSIKLEYNCQECFNALTDKLDWNNTEGYCYPFDLFKSLPLQGRPGYLTVVVEYFFNNDLEYLKTSDPEKTYTTSIMNTKAA